MNRYVALLRGVNVGGRGAVAMADLRRVAEGTGCRDVATILQSGNLLFGSTRETARLGNDLMAALATELGLETTVMVRSASDWKRMIARNPFPEAARRDPARLVVLVLDRAVGRREVAALEKAIVGRETVGGAGLDLYAIYPDGQGRSKLTNAVIERTLKARATARNWNTVMRIAVALDAAAKDTR
jgi:uncharacterized protein (DUF1697 family)